MNSVEKGHETFDNDARFYLMPAAAFFNFVRGVLALAQIKIEGAKSHVVVRAGIEALAGLSIPYATISSLFKPATDKIPPMIIAGTLGFKGLYNGGASVFNWGKALARNISEEARERFRQRRNMHAIGTFILTLATAAVVLAMVIAKAPLQTIGVGLGISAGALGVLVSTYLGITARPAAQRAGYEPLAQSDSDDNDDDLSASSEHAVKPAVYADPNSPRTESSADSVAIWRALAHAAYEDGLERREIYHPAVDVSTMSDSRPFFAMDDNEQYRNELARQILSEADNLVSSLPNTKQRVICGESYSDAESLSDNYDDVVAESLVRDNDLQQVTQRSSEEAANASSAKIIQSEIDGGTGSHDLDQDTFSWEDDQKRRYSV